MPRVKRSEIGRRSGRFEQTVAGAGTATITIIKNATLSVQDYRVYNTGADEISVNISSLSVSFPVNARGSIDLRIDPSSEVSISATFGSSGGTMEGIYDRIDIPRVQVRSGRFRLQTSETIIKSVPGLYRFFNTHRTANATINSQGVPWVIRPGCTLDLSVASDVAATGKAGVYDRIDMKTEVRSGHFRSKVPTNPANPIPPIKIALLTTESTYRFFNSGDHAYDVKKSGDPDPIATVQKFSSVDIVLKTGSSIKVKHETNSEIIKGAYDFIE